MIDSLNIICQHKKSLLKLILQDFQSQNLQPQIGIELEFYLQKNNLPVDPNLVREFISHLKQAIATQNINLLAVELEQGAGQIEVKTKPYLDILQLCEDILKVKKIAKKIANDFGDNLQVNFSSQVYKNDCGSALQINFSLIQNNNYLFARTSEEESQYLLQSVAALLGSVENMMLIFAPEEKDYLRFDLELNRNLYRNGKYPAPTSIGWGYDNRSALLRIPPVKIEEDRRLEFRLGGSDIDIYLASMFFLLAILKITEKEMKPQPATYGNAFDIQYDLKILPNYQQARDYFLNNNQLVDEILLILKNNKFDYNPANSG
ncbi:MAG: Glutamine synthetase, catalytic domain [Rickettsiaceae bacterium]|jgi:glutamine synthetase|nr:Glutamine synthetase, catalytic domain [Rickettsiaceae bacterium]